jgi:hypothetical protein
MGLTYMDMEVAAVAGPDRTEPIWFLVDSGASYSVVPANVLARLVTSPHAEHASRLASGDRIVRKGGTALFKYGDRTGGADVVFGQEGDSQLLGALTLEATGLDFYPLKRELRDLRLVLA